MQGDIKLARRNVLRMLGKVDLREYRDLLPQHDVGLSLMYTPHPSLVPLEMAAAGMIVVTNTCLNKTRQEMSELSPNIIAAHPTIPGIVEALRTAVHRVSDYDARVAGSRVKWPTSWEEALPETVMERLEDWIKPSAGTSSRTHP